MKNHVEISGRGLVALGALLLGVWSPLRAQAAPPTQTLSAEQKKVVVDGLIVQALAAFDARDYARAAELFNQAYALEPLPTVGYNRSKCLEKLGRLLEAEQVARELRARPAPADPDQNKIYEGTQGLLDDLSSRIPTVTVVIAGLPAGKKAELKVDGAAASAEQVLRLDPGAHTISARAEGLAPLDRSVTLKEREVFRLDLTFLTAAPVVVDSPPPPQSSLRTIGLITGAAGLVGIGVGSALGAMAIQKNNESNEGHCLGKVCDLTGQGLRADSIAAGNGSTAAFVIGGAALAAGITMVLIAPRSPSAPAAQVKVGPRGLLLSGTW